VFVKSVKVHVKAVRVLVEAVRVLVEAVRVLVEAVRVLVDPVRVPLEALRLLQKRESVCRGPFDVNKIETKAQTFQYRSLGSKRNPNVLMCSSNFFLQKWNASIYSKNFGAKPKLFDVFFSKRKTFLFIQKFLEQNQNFLMCFNFFLAKAKRFYLIQKLRNNTKTF
jgi:hypothetical protein